MTGYNVAKKKKDFRVAHHYRMIEDYLKEAIKEYVDFR
jgi:hypothetical protein